MRFDTDCYKWESEITGPQQHQVGWLPLRLFGSAVVLGDDHHGLSRCQTKLLLR